MLSSLISCTRRRGRGHRRGRSMRRRDRPPGAIPAQAAPIPGSRDHDACIVPPRRGRWLPCRRPACDHGPLRPGARNRHPGAAQAARGADRRPARRDREAPDSPAARGCPARGASRGRTRAGAWSILRPALTAR